MPNENINDMNENNLISDWLKEDLHVKDILSNNNHNIVINSNLNNQNNVLRAGYTAYSDSYTPTEYSDYAEYTPTEYSDYAAYSNSYIPTETTYSDSYTPTEYSDYTAYSDSYIPTGYSDYAEYSNSDGYNAYNNSYNYNDITYSNYSEQNNNNNNDNDNDNDNNQFTHNEDVIFTYDSLIGFIKAIKQDTSNTYHFVSTLDMITALSNNSNYQFIDYEKEITEAFPTDDSSNGWNTKYISKICIINNQILQQKQNNSLNNNDNRNSGRYTWIQGGSLLRFQTEISDKTEENRPVGTIWIEENNGTTTHAVQVKGFNDSGDFGNTSSNNTYIDYTLTDRQIETDILYLHTSLGTEEHPVPNIYSNGELNVSSDTEAERRTNTTFTKADPVEILGGWGTISFTNDAISHIYLTHNGLGGSGSDLTGEGGSPIVDQEYQFDEERSTSGSFAEESGYYTFRDEDNNGLSIFNIPANYIASLTLHLITYDNSLEQGMNDDAYTAEQTRIENIISSYYYKDNDEYIQCHFLNDNTYSTNEFYIIESEGEDPAVGIPYSDNMTLHGSITTKGGIAAGKSIKAFKIHGAVFNDYAEYRHTDNIQAGKCVIETGKGDLVLSNKRLQLGANIISDTYGFSIGETQYANTPIAVCGRVLAYPYENIEDYQPGEAVCSGPNGTISKMTRDEIKEWPDAIIGYISEIPNYKYWGSDNIEIDGRIWIKVK